jgi:putative endonuclease
LEHRSALHLEAGALDKGLSGYGRAFVFYEYIMFYMYILQSQSTGRYYIGSTSDIDARLARHNHPSLAPPSTRNKGPWILMHSESFQTRSEAMAREKQLKSWKSRKTIEILISSSVGRVPARRD